jgi:hypothetical protein
MISVVYTILGMKMVFLFITASQSLTYIKDGLRYCIIELQ